MQELHALRDEAMFMAIERQEFDTVLHIIKTTDRMPVTKEMTRLAFKYVKANDDDVAYEIAYLLARKAGYMTTNAAMAFEHSMAVQGLVNNIDDLNALRDHSTKTVDYSIKQLIVALTQLELGPLGYSEIVEVHNFLKNTEPVGLVSGDYKWRL